MISDREFTDIAAERFQYIRIFVSFSVILLRDITLKMLISIRILLLVATTLYQAIACWLEDRQSPPGKLVDVGGYRLHLYVAGEASPTVVLDHSLGGVEGYFLIEELTK
ncbi:MAG: hypothetical protein WCD18_17520, partial [Thermosynechococcaceae cyanobacterium]